MKTPLGLVQMRTLPQGATNSMAHMQNAMNWILKDFIPKKTILFVDNISIKGCREKNKGYECRNRWMQNISKTIYQWCGEDFEEIGGNKFNSIYW